MARILIVEDAPANRDLATLVCVQGGHEVISVTNACQAMIVLFEQRIDLMICDLMLPDMDGLALTRSLRSAERWDGMYILAATALSGEGLVDEMREAGMDAVIRKPYRPKDLLYAVDELLNLPMHA